MRATGGEGSKLLKAIFLFALALIVSGCVDPNTGLKEQNTLAAPWVRPKDPQEGIGAKEHPAVLAKYGGLYENAEAERMVAVIVGRLVAVSNDPDRVYKVNILNSPTVNAFALPGGFLYLTRGLLALANDSSELAAVIAHEMAHVTANHAIIRQEKLNSAKFGEQVVAEVLNDSPAGKVALAANQLRIVDFSQEQELQADTIGIRMIGRAGYDAFGAARFLETMSNYRKMVSGSSQFSSANFTSTHPSTPRRIELARRHAQFFGSEGSGKKDRDRYLRGVNGLLYGHTADEGFVRGRTFSHRELGITFEAPEGFKIQNNKKAVLISGPNDIATRFDATTLSASTPLEDYLKSGWINGLVEETIRVETLNGRESGSAKAVGEGWRFNVRVLREGAQLFRFITAEPLANKNTSIDAVSRQIASSFRVLSRVEKSRLKPLEIKLATAGAGNTVDTMARKMIGVKRPAEMFRLINGLAPGDRLIAGQAYKIISD